MASIFLSHSSRNDALASDLESWLKRNRFDDLFVDHKNIYSGDKWTDALRSAKGSCRVVLCLVTPDWLASDECYGEFIAGWYAGRRIIPLLAVADSSLDARQKARLARVLAEDQAFDLSLVGAPGKLDLDSLAEIAEPLKAGLRAAGALAKVGLDPYAFEIDTKIRPEPFPGLESFGDSDADAAIFFGRSTDIAQCLEDLREMRATGDRRAYAIQGASGSGKSSLLKAGILPRLRRERGWLVMSSFRPGANPLLSFAASIAQTFDRFGERKSPGTIRSTLQESWRAATDEAGSAISAVPATLPNHERRVRIDAIESARLGRLRAALYEVVAGLRERAGRPKSTLLIAMDQGEELARADGESGEALGDYLKAALADTPPEGEPAQLMVAFTVRTDSFQELQASKHFQGIATRPADIRRLPTYRLGGAIELPSERYRVEFEPKLVDALMEDATGNDALPLLAFTLQRLWRQFAPEGRIRQSNYADVGKLSGIIEDAAERALRGIDPLAPQGPLEGRIPPGGAKDQAAAHVFVPALAQVNERGAAIRRVALLKDFDEAGRAMLDHFSNWRLVVISGDTVEVAHESMFREWRRFKSWLLPEKARLEALRSVESAAAAWNAKGRENDDLIHRGRRLNEARALDKYSDYRRQLDKSAETRSYLAACGVAERRRRIMIAFGVLAVLSPFLVGQGLRLAAEIKLQRAVEMAEIRKPTAPILSGKSAKTPLQAGAAFRDCVDCPEMVVVPSGAFVMGSPQSEENHMTSESPTHVVRIKRFAVGKYDVTFDEWDACAADGGCQANAHPSDAGWGRGRRPVISVNWNDAHDYARWLSKRTGRSYRLLSESEWEYAARAGTRTPYYTGMSIDEFQANYNRTLRRTQPTGSYPPNGFGVYDMAGNAWCWVEDCWHENLAGAPTDGSAWTEKVCHNRLGRGGAWGSDPTDLRSANRLVYYGEARNVYYTFRVARDLD